MLLAVLVAVFAVVGSALEQSHEPPAQVGTAVVSAAAGESLHDLAARTAPAERVSDSVAVIRRLNHLDGVQVAPASVALLVPVYHG
ncbi:hypothetical protein GCM10027169_37750 [Gordonia jinhuaensis]|uniref:LysM domain-containing protein n=1 Tax=Gordonia jinhuaensis TaxID=1517702 RepID=A0A916WSL1_9ACTN|nr:hypothetical protein GCM10011489_12680 [Gordonia jinhuaensis]